MTTASPSTAGAAPSLYDKSAASTAVHSVAEGVPAASLPRPAASCCYWPPSTSRCQSQGQRQPSSHEGEPPYWRELCPAPVLSEGERVAAAAEQRGAAAASPATSPGFRATAGAAAMSSAWYMWYVLARLKTSWK
eukprot:CAMPEP_0202867310 /NCGR_PEP_ID=MMETSP1391-20130828/9169_1 /ASSEMBLY_ACC=CAM_ASM_000867 /TAXON_ID=1034604 /ORGANISM="Chlamydomonas leiostraca, Strain SAG 11-49" /LENGTH=134 /DNA_ID=CAMNT_0049547345 /DNA_START=310 /DNA_END=715 /DNA_ORIENTATION=-